MSLIWGHESIERLVATFGKKKKEKSNACECEPQL